MFCRLPDFVDSLCARQPSADLFGSKRAFKNEARSFVRSSPLWYIYFYLVWRRIYVWEMCVCVDFIWLRL